jgi:hypothetical protein
MKKILILISSLLFLVSCYEPRSCDEEADFFEVLQVNITPEKTIGLMKFKTYFSPRTETLSFASEKDYLKGFSFCKDKAGKCVDLGMNGVPVLDQGAHGTCVTFATTAALDAILSGRDTISQQCSLELFKGLGNDIWNGAYRPTEVSDPFKQYGVVTKENCPREYPVTYCKLSKEEYGKLIDPALSEKMKDVSVNYHHTISLPGIKKALDNNRRVLIGFLIDASSSDNVAGFNYCTEDKGKCFQGGIWACEQPDSGKSRCSSSNAGHEVVIVGYDDELELFKIRNSWGDSVGDKGDYYMSYKYLEEMALDYTEVY